MEISYGRGGWLAVDGIGLPGRLYVRLDGDEVSELFLAADGGPLRAEALRSIPLATISAVARSRPDLLAAALRDPSPPRVREAMASIVPHRPAESADAARLTAPAGGLTDDFLREVARAYTGALQRGEQPNKSLEEQTGSPRRSVERWVYLARKAGHLPAARPGGVG